MLARTVADLAADLAQRRTLGEPPPAVILGAGASVESGIGAMTELFAFVGVPDFDAFVAYVAPLTAAERYRLLSRFLQTRQPGAPTAGYRALAQLCAERYLDTVLTTNLDPLLDDALAHARLWRRDWLLLVNGVVRPEWLRLLVSAPSPRVKVVKLHGDLFHRCMAWTEPEMEDFLDDVAAHLHAALATRDVLVVGHSLRDARIRELVEQAGGTIWYCTPGAVPGWLASESRVRAVVGPDAAFERLFAALEAALGLAAAGAGASAPAPPASAPPPAPASAPPAAASPAGLRGTPASRPVRADRRRAGGGGGGGRGGRGVTIDTRSALYQTGGGLDDLVGGITGGAGSGASGGSGEDAPPGPPAVPLVHTLDDLAGAVLAVLGPGDVPAASAFLLAEPRVALADARVLESLGHRAGGTVRARGADGRVHALRVLGRADDAHPFGPMLLEAPAALRLPALRLATAPAAPGAPLQAAVAAGERAGLAAGRLTAVDTTATIDGVGRLDGLLAIDMRVAPGASGAPVVDAALAVQGMVVAGGVDAPPTLAIPLTATLSGRRRTG